MATIVFCIHPITGSVHTSLKLARDLAQAGHRIYYLGIADCEPYVSPNGFDFIPLFEQWFPKGWIQENLQDQRSSSKLMALFSGRKSVGWVRTFMDALAKGEDKGFSDAIRPLSPDLMIVVATHYDALIWGLLSYKSGISTVYLFNNFYSTINAYTPPITSWVIPGRSFFSRLRTVFEWQRFLLARFITERMLTLGVDLYSRRTIKRLSDNCRYPIDLIDTATDLIAPKLRLPVLILCPEEFDFPSPAMPGRYYLGTSIDVNRKEPDFPWDKIDNHRPLVYCAMGTLSFLSIYEYKKFYQVIIDVSRLWSQWQWVIVVGKALTVGDFCAVPPQAILIDKAPQLELLKRARMMITHGGTNSVKECIYFGVPMIVFPLGFDQNGNAARVAYHGLGIRGKLKTVTVPSLTAQISQLEKDKYYRIQVHLMQRLFQEREASGLGMLFIETILAASSKE
ncbi:MAG: glycosyltransferase [Nitrososphaera sp.]|nr:glycosyltransferase [Nitrososphaera sp.]